MKKIVILLLISGITSPIFAQLPSSNISFGLKGGLNLSNYDYSVESKSVETKASAVKSFNFSGYVNVPVSPFLSIQSGVTVQGKGSKVQAKQSKPSLSGDIAGNNKFPGEVVIDTKVKVYPTFEDNYISVEIPLNLVANLKMGRGHFFVGGGPYIAYHLTGTRAETIEGSAASKEINTKNDLKFGRKKGDNLQPMDYGINALAGYQLSSGVTFGFGYGLGLADLLTESKELNPEIKNRVLSFSVGYAF